MAEVESITKEIIPEEILHKFLRQQMSCKLLVVAVQGTHAHGYPHRDSPLELKGLHVEPTENLLGFGTPPKARSWVGEFEGFLIDYSSVELGEGLPRLLRGDGSILERVLAPRQVLRSDDLRRLQKVTRGVISQRFYDHYRHFAKGMSRGDSENGEQRSIRHVLGVYRSALTGVHLFLTGQVVLELQELADRYNFSQIRELIQLYRAQPDGVLEQSSSWLNRTVKLHLQLEDALRHTRVPRDPDNPKALEEYLMDMRRRFFDAATVQR